MLLSITGTVKVESMLKAFRKVLSLIVDNDKNGRGVSNVYYFVNGPLFVRVNVGPVKR